MHKQEKASDVLNSTCRVGSDSYGLTSVSKVKAGQKEIVSKRERDITLGDADGHFYDISKTQTALRLFPRSKHSGLKPDCAGCRSGQRDF